LHILPERIDDTVSSDIRSCWRNLVTSMAAPASYAAVRKVTAKTQTSLGTAAFVLAIHPVGRAALAG